MRSSIHMITLIVIEIECFFFCFLCRWVEGSMNTTNKNRYYDKYRWVFLSQCQSEPNALENIVISVVIVYHAYIFFLTNNKCASNWLHQSIGSLHKQYEWFRWMSQLTRRLFFQAMNRIWKCSDCVLLRANFKQILISHRYKRGKGPIFRRC